VAVGVAFTYSYFIGHCSLHILLLLLLLFILTANGFSPGVSGTTIRHNTQTRHITQNNTTFKRNTVHKKTHNEHPTQNANTTITTTIMRVALIKIIIL
jgi:hypothetical protein